MIKLTAYRAADACLSIGLNQYTVNRRDLQGGSFVRTIGAFAQVGPFVLSLQWGRP
jgi:hypothetical protein